MSGIRVVVAAVATAALVGSAAASDESAEQGEVIGDDITDIEDLDIEELLDEPVVESASKRRQSRLDAPLSVTAIVGDEILDLAVDNPAELLRRVPGVHILQPNANAFNVGLRGFNSLGNNHVLTLVDGRNVADLTLGYISWTSLPVHPGDIERIEVLHGPGSTLYGANAMSGVVNIRTKRPIDHPGVEGQATVGTFFGVDPTGEDGNVDSPINNGGSGYAAAAWVNDAESLGVRGSVGFNSIPAWEPGFTDVPVLPGQAADARPGAFELTHGEYQYHGLLSGEYRRGEDTAVFASYGVARAEPEIVIAGFAVSVPMEQLEHAWTVDGRLGGLLDDKLSLRANLDARITRTTVPQLSAPTVRIEGTALHGSVQADLALWDGRNVATALVEGTMSKAEGFFDVDPASSYAGVVLADEIQVLRSPSLRFSGAIRFERIRTDDGGDVEVVYRNLNPRAAAVLSFNDEHSVRLSYATAYRTPTAVESLATVITDTDDMGDPVLSFLVPNPQLKPTQMTAVELGYQLRVEERLRAEVVAFYQVTDDIVGVGRESRLPVRFENIMSLDQIGGTASARHAPADWIKYYGHYTFTRSTSDGDEITEWPAHIIGTGAEIGLGKRFRGRADLNVSSPIDTVGLALVDGGVRSLSSERAWQPSLNLRAGRAFAGGEGEVFIAGRNLIAPFRDEEDLRQHVVDGIEPIGASVVVGISASGL